MEEMRTVTLRGTRDRTMGQGRWWVGALTKKDSLLSCTLPLCSAALGEPLERQTQ